MLSIPSDRMVVNGNVRDVALVLPDVEDYPFANDGDDASRVRFAWAAMPAHATELVYVFGDPTSFMVRVLPGNSGVTGKGLLDPLPLRVFFDPDAAHELAAAHHTPTLADARRRWARMVEGLSTAVYGRPDAIVGRVAA